MTSSSALSNKVNGSQSSFYVTALIGSTCLWSWVDSLYTSTFFNMAQSRLLPELATWLTFLVCAMCGVVFMLRRQKAAVIPSNKTLLVITGALGSMGSLLFAISGSLWSTPASSQMSFILMAGGAVLCGIFMAVSVFSWAAVYCSQGLRSVAIYFTGSFALTFVPDLLFAIIARPVSSFVPAVLPLCANVALIRIPLSVRQFPERRISSGTSVRPYTWFDKISASLRHNLGIKAGTVCSMVFVMFGLGYMQDAISFSRLFSTPGIGSLLAISLPRCACAGVVLLVALIAPRKTNLVYKVGLLVIIAGFSLIPLVEGTSAFWVPGAVMLAGYATFDILIWAIVAQTVSTRFGDPVVIVSLMRLVANGFACVLGGSLGMLFAAHGGGNAAARAIFVGYLVTVATVLILSDRDVWDLMTQARMSFFSAFDADEAPVDKADKDVSQQALVHDPSMTDVQTKTVSEANSAQTTFDQRIAALSQSWGLTDREREVFSLLAIGRTQPWIANELSISDSTVNTHVRHIYGKAGVNSRQELLDLVFSSSSPESVDIKKGLNRSS